jgi:hypothetical protein
VVPALKDLISASSPTTDICGSFRSFAKRERAFESILFGAASRSITKPIMKPLPTQTDSTGSIAAESFTRAGGLGRIRMLS